MCFGLVVFVNIRWNGEIIFITTQTKQSYFWVFSGSFTNKSPKKQIKEGSKNMECFAIRKKARSQYGHKQSHHIRVILA